MGDVTHLVHSASQDIAFAASLICVIGIIICVVSSIRAKKKGDRQDVFVIPVGISFVAIMLLNHIVGIFLKYTA